MRLSNSAPVLHRERHLGQWIELFWPSTVTLKIELYLRFCFEFWVWTDLEGSYSELVLVVPGVIVFGIKGVWFYKWRGWHKPQLVLAILKGVLTGVIHQWCEKSGLKNECYAWQQIILNGTFLDAFWRFISVHRDFILENHHFSDEFNFFYSFGHNLHASLLTFTQNTIWHSVSDPA